MARNELKVKSSNVELDTTYDRPDTIGANLRKKRALELRIGGMSYRQIYDTLVKEFSDRQELLPPSYTPRRVCEDVRDLLREEKWQREALVSELVGLEMDRLDSLMMVAYSSAMRGNVKAVNQCLKIMDMRAKFLNLYPNKTINIRDWRSEVLDLIKTGKITISQVREELGDDIANQLIESGSAGFIESGEVEELDSEDAEFEDDVA